MRDPMLPVGSNRCKCVGCGRYFGGVSGFEAHQRVAKSGDVECRDPAEVGYVVNEAGYWVKPMPEGIVFRPQVGEKATKAVQKVVGVIVGQMALF